MLRLIGIIDWRGGMFGGTFVSLFVLCLLKLDQLRSFEYSAIPVGSKLVTVIFPESILSLTLVGLLIFAIGILAVRGERDCSLCVIVLCVFVNLYLWVGFFVDLPSQVMTRYAWGLDDASFCLSGLVDEVLVPLLLLGVVYLMSRREV